MYSHPFKILKEKIPFLEFISRTASFIIHPKIESEDEFQEGELRYALWDVFLSISLCFTTLSLLALFSIDTSLKNYLSVFSNTIGIFFSFGYYAATSIFSFFFLSLTYVFIFSNQCSDIFKKAQILSLHYARLYALALFVLLPAFLIYIKYYFESLATVQEFTNNSLSISYSAIIFLVIVYIRSFLIPVKKHVTQRYSSKLSYLYIFVITNLALFSNNLYPKINFFSFNYESACKLLVNSSKIKNLDDNKKEIFIEICSKKNSVKSR